MEKTAMELFAEKDYHGLLLLLDEKSEANPSDNLVPLLRSWCYLKLHDSEGCDFLLCCYDLCEMFFLYKLMLFCFS